VGLCLILRSAPAFPLGLGVLGDSGVDEYRGDDNRGGAYSATTFNSIEILAQLRSDELTVGAWGSRAAPRRLGYEHNWARSSSTAGDVHVSGQGSPVAQGQHTGLAAQIAAGDVQLVVMWIGSNDWANGLGNYEPVYDGTIAGTDLDDKIASIVDNVETALDTLIAASGTVRILCTNAIDPGPYLTAQYPNATFRQRVTDAVASANAGVEAAIAARSANVALIDRADWFAILTAAYPLTGDNFQVGSEEIDLYAVGDEPHNFTIGDGIHTGTVGKGVEANLLLIDRFNATWGIGLTRLSDAEILSVAGLP
jgi:hypothetical protein